MVKMSKNEDKRIVKFALPVGSLNDTTRGNTRQLLEDAGFEVEGYEPKKEAMKPRFVNDPEIDAFADRPQNMPPALVEGNYDLAICGSDWVREWELAGVGEGGTAIAKLGELDYGDVEIVVAVRNDSRISSLEELFNISRFDGSKWINPPEEWISDPARIRTEYLNLAKDAVEKAGQERVRFFTTARYPNLGSARVVIEQSYGRTEVGIMNSSSVDAIVEATQTGTSLRNAGLKVIANLFSSTACLYASNAAMEDKPKQEKIGEIASLLEGVVRKRSFEYVTFNVQEEKLPGVISYLKENGYATKEPTVNVYNGNAVISTLLPKKNYPLIVPELLRLGADDIVRLQASQIVSGFGGERK